MPSPMIRKEQQLKDCKELVDQLYQKMNNHDRRAFVRGLADSLASHLTPADRDEWIERMQKQIATPSDDTPRAA